MRMVVIYGCGDLSHRTSHFQSMAGYRRDLLWSLRISVTHWGVLIEAWAWIMEVPHIDDASGSPSKWVRVVPGNIYQWLVEPRGGACWTLRFHGTHIENPWSTAMVSAIWFFNFSISPNLHRHQAVKKTSLLQRVIAHPERTWILVF